MKKRRLLSLFLCAAMVMSLCAVGAGTALAAETEGNSSTVINFDQIVTDITFSGDLYILQDVTLTTNGSVTVDGDVYVFGTLQNNGTLVITGTLNCLHYGSMFSAGNYDYGYVNNFGKINSHSMNVTSSYLNITIPDVEDTSVEEPTIDDSSDEEPFNEETSAEEENTDAGLCSIDVFDDITDTTAWYYDAVDYVYHAGIMTGTSDTTFSPSMTFSRAQMVTVLYRLANSPDVSGLENPFVDVSESDWFYNEVLWAYYANVTTGTGDGTTFSPNDDVTREQVITFLYRFTNEIENHDTSSEPLSDLANYDDVDAVSDWALEAVQWSVGNRIVQGTSATTLEPGNNADRATAAQMIYNYLDGYLG